MAKKLNASYAPLDGYGYIEPTMDFISLQNETRFAVRNLQNQIEAARVSIENNDDVNTERLYEQAEVNKELLSAQTEQRSSEIKTLITTSSNTTNGKIDTVKTVVDGIKTTIGSESTPNTMAYYVKKIFDKEF